MERYSFILGNNPILSIAEIFNREQAQGVDFRIIDLTRKALVVEVPKPINVENWQRGLGGTIKIGTVSAEFRSVAEIIAALNADYLTEHLFPRDSERSVFGFSLYGDVLWRYYSEFGQLGLKLKQELKAKRRKGRFVAATDGALSSVQVVKNKIIKTGADIIIVSGLHGLYLGRAQTVQDFEDYSDRDYGRPRRNARSGMLPPKLAKIMLNLSGSTAGSHLLDPFCGSGTVIQEAMLQGYGQVSGSDISPKAIHDTKQNIEWLKGQYEISRANVNLAVTDVKALGEKMKPASVDTIITEPYLGPPITPTISAIEIMAIMQEIESLYLSAFEAFSQILKNGAKVVIVFPLYKTRDGIFALKILEQLERNGFHRCNPLPDKLSLFAKVGPTARGSLIYSRQDQTVQRELFIFQYRKAEA